MLKMVSSREPVGGLVFLLVVMAFGIVAVESETGLFEPCKAADEYVADKGSCTRYYVCRGEDQGFTTDLATCDKNLTFDLANQTCLPPKKEGLMQDPRACNKFSRCVKTSNNSEGYTRYLFDCPGELRFHPTLMYCTHKIDVPDALCNSQTTSQPIIGTLRVAGQHAAASAAAPATKASAGGQETTAKTTATTDDLAEEGETETTDTTENSPTTTAVSDSMETLRVVTSGDKNEVLLDVKDPPPGESISPEKLDHITNVIKGQLLSTAIN